MTEQEAIKDIEFIKAAYENLAKNGADRYRAVGENVDCAVEVKTNEDLYSHYAVSLGMAAEALKKQIPKKAKHIVEKYGKHKWQRNENGEVDDFAWDYEYHNGVACEVCGKTVCVHCEPDYDNKEDCKKSYYVCPTCEKKTFFKSTYCDCGQKLDWSKNQTEQEPMITFTKTAAVGRSEYIPKPKAIYLGFSSHDCESNYRCPCCNNNFGGWSVYSNKKNENGTKNYCPSCKTELDGLK